MCRQSIEKKKKRKVLKATCHFNYLLYECIVLVIKRRIIIIKSFYEHLLCVWSTSTVLQDKKKETVNL